MDKLLTCFLCISLIGVVAQFWVNLLRNTFGRFTVKVERRGYERPARASNIEDRTFPEPEKTP